MTCRDFLGAAGLLTPSQLLRLAAEKQPLSTHASECRSCQEWLESHRLLGNALQALSSVTAEQQASPHVEQALLQAFRRQEFAAPMVGMPQRASSSLWTLSRIFEVGAYAAVAAALAVGLFLGVRILRDTQSKAAPVEATVTAPQSVPAASSSKAAVGTTDPSTFRAAETGSSGSGAKSVEVAVKRALPAKANAEKNGSETADYMPLMLCDPLICSGDEQVIRMELPAMGSAATDGSSNQTVVADVVIGEDGLVRGMRIVN